MSDKSTVSMGFAVCPICYKEHDETVVLQTRDITHPKLKRRTFTGFDLCPEHKAMVAEYVALVELKNPPANGQTVKPEDARPTGQIAHVRRTAAANIFNVPIPADLPFIYVEVGVIAKLESMTQQGEDESKGGEA